MNKEFVKKMIKAERLRYEAIKEIMPDKLKNRTEKLEKEAFNFLKDISLEILQEDMQESKEENLQENTDTGKKTTKKIDVDFS